MKIAKLACLLLLFIRLNSFAQTSILVETPPSTPTVFDDNGLFVSPSGSDVTGDGTMGKPFHTILHALDQASPGETIILRGGVYREASEVRIRQPRITLRSHRGERAIIQAPLDNEETHSMAVYLDVDASGCVLQGLEISGGYYYGIKMETKWDWGDPEDRSGASDILIEDCIIHDTGRDCIKITPNCDDISIRRCEIYRSGVGPANLGAENAEGIDNVNGDRMRVSDCYLHDIYSTGIYFKGGASDCVVERCRVEKCGGGGIFQGFDTSPEYFDLNVNPSRYECIRGMVRNCLIRETGLAGIAFYAANACHAFHNTLINCARDAHSPIYFGVSLQDWEVDENPNDPYGYRPSSVVVTAKNNLVFQAAGWTQTMVFIRTFEEDDLGRIDALADLPILDDNLYYSAEGAALFTDQRPGHYLEDASLAQWQSHIQGEGASFSQDPLIDASGHLTAASPAVGRAACQEFVTYDIDGRRRQSPCDIGADEWQSATLVQTASSVAAESANFILYPNPGNGRTVLNFFLPAPGLIKIEVYNILAQKMGTLFDGWQAAGAHELPIDAGAWPSGHYWLKINAPQGQWTTTWTLMR